MERPNAWLNYDEAALAALEEVSRKFRAYLDGG